MLYTIYVSILLVPDMRACGVPRITPIAAPDRIVGGQEARAHSWPWQIDLRFDNSHWCGGSILSAYWIITAAHCVYVFHFLEVY